MTEPLIDRWIRRQGWMDGLAEFEQKLIGGFYGALGRPGRLLKDAMHGTKVLGHPLHPAVTDVPIGAWAAAVVADYVAHYTERLPAAAGDIALAVGLVAALLAVLTGYTDFHDTVDHERRVALTHSLTMGVVISLEAVSLALRWWAGPGSHPLAVGLSTAGFALLLFGAYLGGHLVFAIGTMVNRNAFAEPPADFVPVGAPGDFPDDALVRVSAAGMPVLVVRRGGVLHAIAATCSHAGGPLDEGELNTDVITCPWHGSRFCITDGNVVSGPASFAVPLFTVREIDGRVEVKAAIAVH
jgi:nitrite reductase/ring-hydroxylating ferredoxin subunit/uncharacterized membrane protein